MYIYVAEAADCLCWMYVRHAGNEEPTWRVAECAVVGCARLLRQCTFYVLGNSN
jgi:hypothetical protein